MSRIISALIVEDNPNDAELLVLELEREGFQVYSERVDTATGYSEALNQRGWDVIFCDHSMPCFSSFQALFIRNERELDTPFIILSGTMGEDLAVEAMKAGASDYFVKGNLKRLGVAVKRELEESQGRELRRKTEWELQHFVAALTHDMRAPVLGEFRILELFSTGAWGELNEKQKEIVDELIQSNHFLQHMVNNILFSYRYKDKNVTLNLERTDMGKFVSAWSGTTLIKTLLKDKRLNLVVELPEFKPVVNIDRNEMQRVLLNLVKNAIDHSEDSTMISISMIGEEHRLRICVKDSGDGVDPRIEPYLFTPYATSAVRKFHQVGLGLGLYLTRQIVEAHGGEVAYERLEKGSNFCFMLPLLSEWE